MTAVDLKKLYIGGLPYSMTVACLSQIVSEIAPGSTADIVHDRMTGRSAGFGFITAPNSAAVDILIACLNSSTVGGRALTVNEARPMEPRRRGFGSTSTRFPEISQLHVAVAEHVAELNSSNEVITLVNVFEHDLVAHFATHPEEMKSMNPHLFERLIADIWTRMGYEVELQKQTRDGGIDVIAMRRSEADLRFLIQCKRPAPNKKVSVEVVRSLLGVKQDHGGSKAILATTVPFTNDARLFLDRHKWDLEGRDYDGLLDWLSRATCDRKN